METAMRADVVPWYVAMDEEVRTGLVDFLEEESRKKKKRPAVDVSPDDTEATDENYPPRQPLVNVQPRQSRVNWKIVTHKVGATNGYTLVLCRV